MLSTAKSVGEAATGGSGGGGRRFVDVIISCYEGIDGLSLGSGEEWNVWQVRWRLQFQVLTTLPLTLLVPMFTYTARVDVYISCRCLQ